MKQLLQQMLSYKIWLGFFLIKDFIFGIFLWLIDTEAFWVLWSLLFLISILFFVFVNIYIWKKEQCKLEEIEIEDNSQIPSTTLLEYEEYIESWAHEIKTPLSLMTLLLDNREEEMSPAVYRRFLYIRGQMQDSVNQMLYYARVKAIHKDYRMERVDISLCCMEMLEEYHVFFREKDLKVIHNVPKIEVVTDKKSFLFMLSQVIRNSLFYQKKGEEESSLWLEGREKEEGMIELVIRDNGVGVHSCDLPFLFEKGFTGETIELQKKSTGMGLYLVKQLAEDLNIDVKVASKVGEGFEIRFLFPVVR